MGNVYLFVTEAPLGDEPSRSYLSNLRPAIAGDTAVGEDGNPLALGLSGADGASGASGWSGWSGMSGARGTSGYSGMSGQSGVDGASGYSGSSGFSGFSGWSGYSGYSGFSGIGYSGFSGRSGFSGISGQAGLSGFSGLSGYSGLGLSGYSGYSGFSGIPGTGGWVTIYSGAGVTPTSANILPYTGLGVYVGWGVRVTYDDGGEGGYGDSSDLYAGIISAVALSTSFTTHLGIFSTSYGVTKIEVCHPSALITYSMISTGLYALDAHDDLMTDQMIAYPIMVDCAVGRVYAKQWADDSAATTSEPTINLNVGGSANLVFAAEVEMTVTYADFTAAPDFDNYLVSSGDIIDIKVTKATGGTPGDDARNLAAMVVGVPL